MWGGGGGGGVPDPWNGERNYFMAQLKRFACARVYRNCPNIQVEIIVPDPWRFDTNPDPDPALFFRGLQNKVKLLPIFFAFYLPTVYISL